jgi:hypothetical protein
VFRCGSLSQDICLKSLQSRGVSGEANSRGVSYNSSTLRVRAHSGPELETLVETPSAVRSPSTSYS